jgi:hypothetical protein
VTRGVLSQEEEEEETQIRVPLLPFLRSYNQATTKSEAFSQKRTTPPKNVESSQREKKMQKAPTLHNFRHNSFKNPTTDASHSNRHTERHRENQQQTPARERHREPWYEFPNTHTERNKERKDQKKTHDKNYRNTTCQPTKNKQTNNNNNNTTTERKQANMH